jgi:hypothetical protein
MKEVIQLMLRSANLQVYNLFTRWKLNTFTDKERRRMLKEANNVNRMGEVLTRIYRTHLKAGVNGIAGDSMNTNMRRKIVNRLNFIAFGKIQEAFNIWKYDTFNKLKIQMEHTKAKVIDRLIRAAMSGE